MLEGFTHKYFGKPLNKLPLNAGVYVYFLNFFFILVDGKRKNEPSLPISSRR